MSKKTLGCHNAGEEDSRTNKKGFKNAQADAVVGSVVYHKETVQSTE